MRSIVNASPSGTDPFKNQSGNQMTSVPPRARTTLAVVVRTRPRKISVGKKSAPPRQGPNDHYFRGNVNTQPRPADRPPPHRDGFVVVRRASVPRPRIGLARIVRIPKPNVSARARPIQNSGQRSNLFEAEVVPNISLRVDAHDLCQPNYFWSRPVNVPRVHRRPADGPCSDRMSLWARILTRIDHSNHRRDWPRTAALDASARGQ